MIDIHSHILPEIDDGAKDLDMTINMAKIAVAEGIREIIATPHFIEGAQENGPDIVNKSVKKINQIFIEKNIDLKLYPGCELFINHNVLQQLSEHKINTLNNSQYVLMELPMNIIPRYAMDIIYNLRLKDYIPVIAHPERYNYIMDDPNLLYDLINQGALIQVNAASIRGLFGKKVTEITTLMLNHNLIHFIATDAHTNNQRSPKIKDIYNMLKEKYGPDHVENLFTKNSKSIINDSEIKIEPPERIEKKKWVFIDFFKNLGSRKI